MVPSASFQTAFRSGLILLFFLAPLPVIISQNSAPVPINMDVVRELVGYPEEAKLKGLTGEVVAKLLVNEDGTVLKFEILSSPDTVFTYAVSRNLSALRFQAAIVDSVPSKCWVTLPFKFSLIDITKQTFTNLDEIAANQNDVTNVNLSNLGLTEFPTELLLCNMLHELDLSSNQIKEVPELIRLLSELRILRLDGNPLEKLPNDIASLENLEILTLTSEKISEEHKEWLNRMFGNRIQWK